MRTITTEGYCILIDTQNDRVTIYDVHRPIKLNTYRTNDIDERTMVSKRIAAILGMPPIQASHMAVSRMVREGGNGE